MDGWSRRLSGGGGRGQAACLPPFFLRNEGGWHLLSVHGRSPWGWSLSGTGHISLLHLPGRGGCEPAHQRSRHIEGMLDISFALGDISGPALRHERREKAAGDAKFYVGGHWVSEALSMKGLHIEAFRRRLARDGICVGSQILKLTLNA